MSNKLQRAKALGSESEIKKQERIGPPWAPKSVRPPAVIEKNELDETLAKAKDAGDGGRVGDSRADFIASTHALIGKKKGSKSKAAAQLSVGDDSLNKVVGPPWSPKEFLPATESAAGDAAARMDNVKPKRG